MYLKTERPTIYQATSRKAVKFNTDSSPTITIAVVFRKYQYSINNKKINVVKRGKTGLVFEFSALDYLWSGFGKANNYKYYLIIKMISNIKTDLKFRFSIPDYL